MADELLSKCQQCQRTILRVLLPDQFDFDESPVDSGLQDVILNRMFYRLLCCACARVFMKQEGKSKYRLMPTNSRVEGSPYGLQF